MRHALLLAPLTAQAPAAIRAAALDQIDYDHNVAAACAQFDEAFVAA
jgi:hypothetical protein